MRVHCDEGIANRIGPEPCAGIREDVGDASVGVCLAFAPGCLGGPCRPVRFTTHRYSLFLGKKQMEAGLCVRRVRRIGICSVRIPASAAAQICSSSSRPSWIRLPRISPCSKRRLRNASPERSSLTAVRKLLRPHRRPFNSARLRRSRIVCSAPTSHVVSAEGLLVHISHASVDYPRAKSNVADRLLVQILRSIDVLV